MKKIKNLDKHWKEHDVSPVVMGEVPKNEKKKQKTIKAWGIIIDGKLCYTSAPEIIYEGTIWQIYKTRKEAKEFLQLPFGEQCQYKIVKVEIKILDK